MFSRDVPEDNGRSCLRTPSEMRNYIRSCRTRENLCLARRVCINWREFMEGSTSDPPLKCDITYSVVVLTKIHGHGRDGRTRSQFVFSVVIR